MAETTAAIIVFGVSGVGKTSACRSFLLSNPGFVYLRASEILSDTRRVSSDSLRALSKEEVMSNQFLLAEALAAKRQAYSGVPILLDAHAVIDNDLEYVPVPLKVIAAFRPTGLILLEASAEKVLERRLKDSRSRPIKPVTDIVRELCAERATSEAYSHALGCPLITVDANGVSGLSDAVSRVMGQSPGR